MKARDLRITDLGKWTTIGNLSGRLNSMEFRRGRGTPDTLCLTLGWAVVAVNQDTDVELKEL